MNNKNLDALFTGLTGTPKSSSSGQPSTSLVPKAAFEKAIKSYERRNGPVDGRMKGDAKNLF